MTPNTMKLFVWEDELISCASSMMVAIAPTVEAARAQILKEYNYIPAEALNQQPEEFDLTEPAAFVCFGW